MTLTVGSLFAGIGGFDLGFEQAAFEPQWQVEWDDHAIRVLEAKWPHVQRYRDIRDVDPAELEPVDVITFGSPCQDLSVAGKRAGLSGERSGLFHEAVRIIAGVRPSVAIWENVPGAFSSHGGRDFAAVLAAFRECGAREFGWRVLDAQYFGVAQRRRRVFLVADFRGHRASKILFEPESLSGHPPTRDEARTVAPTLPASGAGTGRTGNERTEADFCIPMTSRTLLGKTNDSYDESLETYVLSAFGISNQPTPKFGLDIAPTLDAKESGGGRMEAVVTGMAVRRLLPVECERLQGLPDDWTRWDADGKELSDSARYRLIGNAVAVPVARWLAERIKNTLEEGTQ